MGMYTTVRGNLLLTEYGQSVIQKLYRVGSWLYLEDEYPWVVDYAVKCRSDFIPFGALSYSPPGVGKDDDGLIGPRWVFHCSLKNYEGEAEEFASSIVPRIAEEVRLLETWYEEKDRDEEWDVLIPPGPVRKE